MYCNELNRIVVHLGYDKIVLMLLQNGADVNGKGNKGDEAIHFAADRGCFFYQETLMYWKLIWFTYDLGYDKIVEILIEKGANLSSKNVEGTTPLHRAANQGNLYIHSENHHQIQGKNWVFLFFF